MNFVLDPSGNFSLLTTRPPTIERNPFQRISAACADCTKANELMAIIEQNNVDFFIKHLLCLRAKLLQ